MLQQLTLRDGLRAASVVPTAVLHNAEETAALVRLLRDADYPMVEILHRSPFTWEALRQMRRELPELQVGVGTLLRPEDVARAAREGAQFAVSPGWDPELWDAALTLNLPYMPGVATPSEAQQLKKRGGVLAKFFPAAALGAAYLEQMSAAFPDLHFTVSGGLRAENWQEFLELKAVLAVSGSWMLPKNYSFDPDHSGLVAVLRTLRTQATYHSLPKL